MDNSQDTWGKLLDALTKFFPYISTFFLSAWGGLVNHIQQIREGRFKFSWANLFFDLVVSTFVGLLTLLLCKFGKVDETMSAILIAVSGHMGTRAIRAFQSIWGKYLNIPADAIPPEQPPKDAP